MNSILKVDHVSISYKIGDFKDIGLKEWVMRHLKKEYHVETFKADDDICFELERGDMLGIIGTNGAGKSTLLKAICGVMEPREGYIERNGSISALLELASGFDGDLTVKENAYLRGAMLGYTRDFMNRAYQEIIDFAELKDFEDRPFKQLSTGMQSRLAFAIASMVQPEILILDEVLSVGDGAFRAKSEKKMREIISGGACTILVSHSIEQVRELCNKVLWLDHGKQVAFGDAESICDAYAEYLETGKISTKREENHFSEGESRSSSQISQVSKENSEQNPKLVCLDFLRVLGMLMIFFNHVWGFLPFSIPDLGARGVEIFFLLSGFLLIYNHYNDDVALKNSPFVAISRIKKFYPLHIITLAAVAMLTFSDLARGGEWDTSFLPTLKSLVLNLLLLQSWSTNQTVYWGFNGVSWFLSSLLFCYFLFPLFLIIVHKIESKQMLMQTVFVLFIALAVFHTWSASSNCFDAGYYLYIFPPYRAYVFFLGCLSGAYFLKTKSFDKVTNSNAYAGIAIILSYVVAVFLCNGSWSSAIYLPIEMLLIYLLASQPSRMECLYSNKPLKLLSSVSFDFYLVHHVVVLFWSRYCWNLFGERTPAWGEHIIYMFIISLGISFFLHYLISKFISLKKG